MEKAVKELRHRTRRKHVGILLMSVAIGWFLVFGATFSPSTPLPVVANGGAGAPSHVVRALASNASGKTEYYGRQASKALSGGGKGSCTVLEPHENVSSVLSGIQLCSNEAECTTRLSFSYLDPVKCELQKRTLSRDTTLNEYLVNTLGPDVFRWRLEGPQTFAGVVTRASSGGSACSYSVDFPVLEEPGSYRLAIEWLYDNYNAMDELTNQWPPLLKQSLLPIDETFQTNYHRQQCTLPSRVDVQCRRKAERRTDDRMVCSGLERFTGGWWEVDEGNLGRPVYTRVRVRKIQRNPIVFEWALQPDTARHWRPRDCHLAPYLKDHVLPALRSASPRIVVGGDSQLRALYFGTANFLNGHEKDCLRNISTVSGEPRHCIENVKGSQRKQIGGVQLDFVDDLFLDRFARSERYAAYDTIVVGFAQHPASKEHWTFDRFRSSFQAKLRKALQLKALGKCVIWYLSPQYPHTKVGFPIHVKDWRTDIRLQMFNSFAKAECLKHNIRVVDGFEISTPYSHTSPDQAHFSNFVSFEIVRMLLNVMCSHIGNGRCLTPDSDTT